MKPIAIYLTSKNWFLSQREDGLCLTLFSSDSCADSNGGGFDDSAFSGIASINGE